MEDAEAYKEESKKCEQPMITEDQPEKKHATHKIIAKEETKETYDTFMGGYCEAKVKKDIVNKDKEEHGVFPFTKKEVQKSHVEEVVPEQKAVSLRRGVINSPPYAIEEGGRQFTTSSSYGSHYLYHK